MEAAVSLGAGVRVGLETAEGWLIPGKLIGRAIRRCLIPMGGAYLYMTRMLAGYVWPLVERTFLTWGLRGGHLFL